MAQGGEGVSSFSGLQSPTSFSHKVRIYDFGCKQLLPLHHHDNFYGGTKEKQTHLYHLSLHKCSNWWHQQKIIIVSAALLQQTSISFMAEEHGSLELPVLSSDPGLALLGREGPDPAHPGHSNPESGPSSHGSTLGMPLWVHLCK